MRRHVEKVREGAMRTPGESRPSRGNRTCKNPEAAGCTGMAGAEQTSRKGGHNSGKSQIQQDFVVLEEDRSRWGLLSNAVT